MRSLFAKQPMALQAAFSELKRRASEQPFLLVGTPGTVVVRDERFFYRDHYGPEGKKAADYVGPVGDIVAERRANELRAQIALANELIHEARLLAQNGYVRVDARSEAVLAALVNNGVFRTGTSLIGSHAFGALLNDLGVRAVPFATEDLDIARDGAPTHDRLKKTFEDILRESRVPLSPIPRLNRKEHSTSFALVGRSKFRVDLLVPTRGTEVKILPLRELGAYATALPHLGYLLHEPSPALVIGRNAMIPVSVPQPERFACHKMLVSQLRRETSEKRQKDIEQASILVAVLAEVAPEGLEAAFGAIPRPAIKQAKRGARRVLERLEGTSHAIAVELMKELLE